MTSSTLVDPGFQLACYPNNDDIWYHYSIDKNYESVSNNGTVTFTFTPKTPKMHYIKPENVAFGNYLSKYEGDTLEKNTTYTDFQVQLSSTGNTQFNGLTVEVIGATSQQITYTNSWGDYAGMWKITFTTGNTGVTIKIKPKYSASAPLFQMAFDPFVAHADSYTSLLPSESDIADAAATVSKPEGYEFDADWGGKIITLNDANDWQLQVDDLPVFDEHGQAYCYAIVEKDVPAAYTVTYNPGEETPTAVLATAMGSDVTLKATNTFNGVDATPEAQKKLNGVQFGGKLSNGNDVDFTFELREVDYNNGNAVGSALQTVTTNNVGQVSFAPIHYSEPCRHIYEISEQQGTVPGVHYDPTKIYWLVVVWRNPVTGELEKQTDAYYKNVECNVPLEKDHAVFHNNELTQIHVEKSWYRNDQKTTVENIEYITVELWRKGTSNERVNPATVTLPDNCTIDGTQIRLYRQGESSPYTWAWDITNLDKYYYVDADRAEYEYYIVEKDVPAGWSVTYSKDGETYNNATDGNSVAGDGTFYMKNSTYTVQLPATGGVGTTVVYVAGSGLLLLAILGWLLSARKRRD